MLDITAKELQERTERANWYHESLMKELAEGYFKTVFNKQLLIDAANKRESKVHISIPDKYLGTLSFITKEFTDKGFVVIPHNRRGDFWISWRTDPVPVKLSSEGCGFVD